jgi:hypothetical protein
MKSFAEQVLEGLFPKHKPEHDRYHWSVKIGITICVTGIIYLLIFG